MGEILKNMDSDDREEFFGRLVDVVQDWLDERGEDITIDGEEYNRLVKGFAEAAGMEEYSVSLDEDFGNR